MNEVAVEHFRLSINYSVLDRFHCVEYVFAPWEYRPTGCNAFSKGQETCRAVGDKSRDPVFSLPEFIASIIRSGGG